MNASPPPTDDRSTDDSSTHDRSTDDRPSRSPTYSSPPTVDFVSSGDADEIVRILDEYLAALKSGRPLDRAQLLAAHPHLADQLNACLAGLEFIQGVSQTLGDNGAADEAASGRTKPESADKDRDSDKAANKSANKATLGDFRIVREVGRGGMGAVYEAQQLSLGRRVALKVLRFGGVADPEALDRFRREAETVARLHHTNIVPIFAVGTDQGVNYYAMQFIDGPSLAEVLADRRTPLDPHEVAQWGLQAAEALEHAHARGVIHRDVKPSNLLLDAEGRIWLTDFGLARRLDDVTLSMTGALLGTPRYMSPEQASAAKRQVDRRTDIYSLGATLYELLAGKPAFSGDTPHEVIQRILSTEPEPLGRLRPALPRDLETIVMKCLAKESERRYESARELANDLRAWIENRPISARRAGWLERSRRWLKRHRPSVTLALGAAAATLVVMIAGLGGSSAYQASRRAEVSLSTKSPPLVAELLDDDGEVQAAVTVPTQRPLSVVGGDYSLRVSGGGRFSETFEISIPRGAKASLRTEIDDGLLWSPRPLQRGWLVVRDGLEDRLLEITDTGIERNDWRTRLPIWNVKLDAGLPAESNAPGFLWPWQPNSLTARFALATGQPPIGCLPHTVDLNGDGAGDFVFHGLCQAWVLAVSGVDGRVLWIAARGSDVRAPLGPAANDIQFGEMVSRAVGTPADAGDLDDDGVPDFVTTWIDRERRLAPTEPLAAPLPARRWIEAISGATGKTLWERPLPPEWFTTPDPADGALAEVVPQGWRWDFSGSGGMHLSGSGYSVIGGRLARFNRPSMQLHGPHVELPSVARRVRFQDEDCVAFEAGRQAAILSLSDGQLVQSMVLDARSFQPGEWADLDGDGHADLVIVSEASPAAGAMMGPRPPTSGGMRLSAWSLAKQSLLWSHDLPIASPGRMSSRSDPPRWPVVVDLNGDGRAETIVPDGNAALAGGAFGEGWGSLATYDGTTGNRLWTRRIPTCDMQVDYFLAGPDIDGDGWRDVFAATISGLPLAIHVDALSGQTGAALWSRRHVIPKPPDADPDDSLIHSSWWNAGEDGWPQLVVHAGAMNDEASTPHWCAFSAGTGEVTRVGVGITHVDPADIDGDGVDDLLTFSAKSASLPGAGGDLGCVRGVGRELWRRLGRDGRPTVDLNGDGVRDLLEVRPRAEIVAWCGRTGHLLWQSTEHGFQDSIDVKPLSPPPETRRAGDIDGDGIVDFVVLQTGMRTEASTAVAVLSGKTGRRLWIAAELNVRVSRGAFAVSGADLDQDGKSEIVLVTACDLDYPAMNGVDSGNLQLWLIVLHADGRVRWRQPLSRTYGRGQQSGGVNTFPLNQSQSPSTLEFADLDGDDVLDIVTPRLSEPANNDRRLEWQAFSGRDGSTLWTYRLPTYGDANLALAELVPPAIHDLDGDREPEVIFVTRSMNPELRLGATPVLHVELLDGRQGTPRWRWLSDEPLVGGHAGLRRGDSRSDVSVPVVARRADGSRQFVLQQAGSPCHLWTFDARGLVRGVSINQQATRAGLWAIDVDQDGSDEILYALAQEIRAAKGDQLDTPVWSFPIPSGVFPTILGVRLDDARRQGELDVLYEPTDNQIVTLDAATGQVRWKCPGPQPRDGADLAMVERIERLNVGELASEAPCFWFAYGTVSRVRQSKAAPQDATKAVSEYRVAARLEPPALDFRWKRSLPWAPDDAKFSEIASTLAASLIWGTLIVFAPVAFVFNVLRRGSWSLRELFALTGILGVALGCVLSTALDSWFRDTFHPLDRLWIALMATPPVVMGWLLARWLRTGRRLAAYVWLGVTAAMSVVPAGIIVSVDFSSRPLQPDEYYSWDGWWLAGVAGVYMTSWIVVIVTPLVELGKRFLGRAPRRPAPWRRAEG